MGCPCAAPRNDDDSLTKHQWTRRRSRCSWIDGDAPHGQVAVFAEQRSMSASANTLAAFSGQLVLVGAGKMGSAMLEGWLGLGLEPRRVVVREPQPTPEIAALAGRGLALNPIEAPRNPDVVVLAVKPQSAAEVVPAIAPLVGANTVVLSIMAGKTLAALVPALP